MTNPVTYKDIFGFVRPGVDAHTLGINEVANLISQCGYEVHIAKSDLVETLNSINLVDNFMKLKNWLLKYRITRVGFSYRLDPNEALMHFGRLYYQLKDKGMLEENQGPINTLYFAGLPDSAKRIEDQFRGKVEVFKGNETSLETLEKIGINIKNIPYEIIISSKFDENRLQYAENIIEKGRYDKVKPIDRSGSIGYGTRDDLLINRVNHSCKYNLPPLMRAHVGPYDKNRKDALILFREWLHQLSKTGLLDVVSIGTSQLTQSSFGEDWGRKPNGGGVPINSAEEFIQVWHDSRPMLVRTYAGTKNIRKLAQIYETSINIAWHALSFWWFCQIDGRGPNTVYTNLKEHVETLEYIAKTEKPYEPNIPHHFAFRGADDVTYVLSALIAAKTAKLKGIRYLVLQAMLNTPRNTWGIQDLAKSRALVKLVRELEDENFNIILQPRAGLDYLSNDLKKAKYQLSAVTTLMDDIEPNDNNSPHIIHVVSYSEASYLADPETINESIKITRYTIEKYRQDRKKGLRFDIGNQNEIDHRTEKLVNETKFLLNVIEKEIDHPYTPEGLYKIFASGFLPVPYLWECRDEFIHAINWKSKLINGSINLVDENNIPISIEQRSAIVKQNLKCF